MLSRAFLALVSAMAIFTSSAWATEPTPSAREERLSDAAADLVERYAKLGRFSGAALLGVGGEIVYSGAAGLASREHAVPNRPDTRFPLASLSKQFTAAAILELAREDRLALEDPIAKLLPGYPPPQGQRVQIHHLLSMSSGIPSLWRRGDGLESIEESGDPVSLQDLLATFWSEPLLFEPGAEYRYSNSNYIVLAAIIQQLAGTSWASYLEEDLFAPLRLGSTGVLDSAVVIRDLADGYVGYPPDLHRPMYVHSTWKIGSGGLYSTVGDLFRWTQILQSDRLLPKPYRDRLFSEHVARGEGGAYGYGWFIAERDGNKLISHGGGIEGYRSQLYMVPEREITVIVLTNHVAAPAVDMATEVGLGLLGLTLSEPVPLPPMPADLPLEDPELFVGLFPIAEGRFLRVESTGGQLRATAKGNFPWSVPTWFRMSALDPAEPKVQVAARFLRSIAAGDTETAFALFPPEIRSEEDPAGLAEAWREFEEQWGSFVEMAPFGLGKDGEFDQVSWLAQFEKQLVHIDVVMAPEGGVVGWWENPDVPQRAVRLLPAADGTFFVDAFRWRLPDPRISFEHGPGGKAVGLTILAITP